MSYSCLPVLSTSYTSVQVFCLFGTHSLHSLFSVCARLCQCCISNTDKTYKIAFVRSSGSGGGFGVCLFICVIKSQAQQGKWKPYSPNKVICGFDTSSGPHKIHMTPTYLRATAEPEATPVVTQWLSNHVGIHGWYRRQGRVTFYSTPERVTAVWMQVISLVLSVKGDIDLKVKSLLSFNSMRQLVWCSRSAEDIKHHLHGPIKLQPVTS